MTLLRSHIPRVLQEGTPLPDEILLQVFGLLPIRELLLGPLHVCRRWRALALHPSSWKDREVLYPDGPGVRKAVLHLAPCVKSLYVDTRAAATEELRELARSSDCVLYGLSASLSGPGYARGLAMVRGMILIHLDQLQKVELSDIRGEDARDLLAVLDGAPRLSSLELGPQNESAKPVRAPLAPASELRPYVKQLKYIAVTKDPLLEWLIERHAPTLVCVVVERKVTRRALDLLGTCPGLETVELPFMVEASVLRRCPSLTSLSLDGLTQSTLDVVGKGVCMKPLDDFLRQATNLRKLHFTGGVFHGKTLRNLLLALSSSGRSALEELSINEVYHTKPLYSYLRHILPGLPSLRSLSLPGAPQVKNLVAFSVRFAPRLRFLGLSSFLSEAYCRRDGCYLVAWFRLVSQSPALHVTIPLKVHRFPCVGGCECCSSGLHALAKGKEGVYGHAPGERCEEPQLHFWYKMVSASSVR